jgi:hypothetical protein
MGPLFEGTQFDGLKERGATMSPMFCKLVCDASDMKLNNMIAEYYVDAGEIDGVEFDEEGNVISIYECQSGIHKGEELDELHLGKALQNYLYDPKILPTVRKIVILAGGYSESTIRVFKERQKELESRGVQIIPLFTLREQDRILVERLEF